MSFFLDILPNEITLHLLSFSSVLDLVVMMYVCKTTKKISVDILKDCKSLQYVRLTKEIAATGSLPLLEWAHKLKYKFDVHVWSTACHSGHLHILKWMHKHKLSDADHRSYKLTKRNHTKILDWGYEKGFVTDLQICELAAKRGDLSTLKSYIKRGCKWDVYTPYLAAKYGHFEMLQWIHSTFFLFKDSDLIATGAAKGGHIEILQWVVTRYTVNTISLCEYATMSGQLKVLKFLSTTINSDGEYGMHTNITEFAEHIDRTNSVIIAARGGMLEILKWFKRIKCVIPDSAANESAVCGQLHIIEWLISDVYKDLENIPVSEILKTIGKSIMHGHPAVLEFFKNNWSTFSSENPIFSDFEDAMQISKWVNLNGKKYGNFHDLTKNIIAARSAINNHNEKFAKYT